MTIDSHRCDQIAIVEAEYQARRRRHAAVEADYQALVAATACREDSADPVGVDDECE